MSLTIADVAVALFSNVITYLLLDDFLDLLKGQWKRTFRKSKYKQYCWLEPPMSLNDWLDATKKTDES